MYLQTRAASASNASIDALQVLCGYPLSGPYEVMPRIVLYLLMVMAFSSRTALVAVILWTSVAAIHLCALAKFHTSAALDMDLLPATSAVLLGLLISPAYIQFSRGLKGFWRVDMFATCLWMVLLWCGMISYLATMKLQPATVACLDSSNSNITSRSMLSHCSFQCHNVSTEHAMRASQTAVLITRPGGFFTGHGKTIGGWPFAGIAFLMALTFAGFWMATQRSVFERLQESLAKRKDKKGREGIVKGYLLPGKVAFLASLIVLGVWESGFKHIPGTERRDTIGQWGPLVVLALVMIGFMFRKLLAPAPQKESATEAELQTQQPATVVDETEPTRGADATSLTDAKDSSQTTEVTSPQQVHVREVTADKSQSDG